MILGLGVDLCSIIRMKRAVRSEHFVRRIFHPEEIAYADGKGNELARAASFASAFAAREAFAKAGGVSMYKLAFSRSFCLERSNTGGPRLAVPRDLDADFEEGRKRAWVSLSHDGDYAVAVVVIETGGACHAHET
ncbi:MAG: 4'-phosphopantetheinyl transferase superfamily protein [Synergistaceae bacterium]|nr:4'-phosphopantetheinyl transferase superfamily protein [Synergistaceae bacterium]